MTTQKVLLIYSTTDGRSLEIISRIAKELTPESYDLVDIKEIASITLTHYDTILLGASIRYGHFNKAVYHFINNNVTLLNNKKTAFFGVCVTARKPAKDTAETNGYIVKFFKKVAWKPQLKAVFAGALFYPRYNFLDKNMIRFIMWMGGEKNHKMDQEYNYTNWDKVDLFAKQFVQFVNEE